MKMERLGQDKIRIFLTFEDLSERGIQKEDIWREIPKVHELFSEMMDQAYDELGFEASGPLAVEVFAMPAQGMVVVVTRGKADRGATDDSETEMYEIEMKLEQGEPVIFQFANIEDVIGLAKTLPERIEEGTLYLYQKQWVLAFQAGGIAPADYACLVAVLTEYGSSSPTTLAVLEEYAHQIIPKRALKVINEKFGT